MWHARRANDARAVEEVANGGIVVDREWWYCGWKCYYWATLVPNLFAVVTYRSLGLVSRSGIATWQRRSRFSSDLSVSRIRSSGSRYLDMDVVLVSKSLTHPSAPHWNSGWRRTIKAVKHDGQYSIAIWSFPLKELSVEARNRNLWLVDNNN